MKGEPGLDRRTLLRLAGCAALAALGSAGPAQADPWRGLPLRRRSATRVGRAFLERHPEEADPAALRRRLGLPERGLGTLSASDRQSWWTGLRSLQRDDFRRGRVVALAGWTLSLTECRLGALACLDG